MKNAEHGNAVPGYGLMNSFAVDHPHSRRKNRDLRWPTFIAGFYLVLMCVQYWPVEGYGTSMLKVAFMCLSPLILLTSLRPSADWKVFVCCGVCLFWKCSVAYFQTAAFRPETLAYSVAFFMTYAMFYTLVHNGCFSLKQAQKLLESLLWAYIIVLIIQQIYSLAGGGEWKLMNLYLARLHPLKCQSLSLEPSHSGRIMGAMFYALLKVWEFQYGTKLSLRQLWNEHRGLSAGFGYAMISMQSATSMFVLLLLLLYFFKWKYVLPFIVLLLLLPTIQEVTESHELGRVLRVLESCTSGDVEKVIKADHSASFRVLPILNTLQADFTDPKLWFGHGIDTARNLYFEAFSQRGTYLPGVKDFGLIDYLLSSLLVFSCCIRPFKSLPMLMYFAGVGGATVNGAYGWGILMIFTIVSFFHERNLSQSGLDQCRKSPK